MENDANLFSIVKRFDELGCVQIESDGRERKLVLSKSVNPSQVILLIPPKSLLNVKTIDKYLDSQVLPSPGNISHESNWKNTVNDVAEAKIPLTSVQSLTLLLAAWRSLRNTGLATSTKDLDEILSTIPKSYPHFPIVWKVESEQKDKGKTTHLAHFFRALLDSLPNHIAHLCEQVLVRFVKDCNAIRSVQKYAPERFTFNNTKIDQLEEIDLLWGWCSVNSRCVYLPLGLKPSKENFTLAPLLDMANHTMEPRLECKVKWTPNGGLQLSAPAKTYEPRGLSKGQEVMIAYGAHSNGTLLSEYGFNLCLCQDKEPSLKRWNGNPFAEINVDEAINLLLSKDLKCGPQKVQILRDVGYYGDYTIHPHPMPVHASFRLVVALRLVAIDNLNSQDLQVWRDMISGGRDDISTANEATARKLLVDLCDYIIQNRTLRIEKLLAAVQDTLIALAIEHGDRDKSLRYNLDMVKKLLEEEIFIAQLMKDALSNECTYW